MPTHTFHSVQQARIISLFIKLCGEAQNLAQADRFFKQDFRLFFRHLPEKWSNLRRLLGFSDYSLSAVR
jgi:hypothetical protein